MNKVTMTLTTYAENLLIKTFDIETEILQGTTEKTEDGMNHITIHVSDEKLDKMRVFCDMVSRKYEEYNLRHRAEIISLAQECSESLDAEKLIEWFTIHKSLSKN